MIGDDVRVDVDHAAETGMGVRHQSKPGNWPPSSRMFCPVI
jgi:hypothetical protein